MRCSIAAVLLCLLPLLAHSCDPDTAGALAGLQGIPGDCPSGLSALAGYMGSTTDAICHWKVSDLQTGANSGWTPSAPSNATLTVLCPTSCCSAQTTSGCLPDTPDVFAGMSGMLGDCASGLSALAGYQGSTTEAVCQWKVSDLQDGANSGWTPSVPSNATLAELCATSCCPTQNTSSTAQNTQSGSAAPSNCPPDTPQAFVGLPGIPVDCAGALAMMALYMNATVDQYCNWASIGAVRAGFANESITWNPPFPRTALLAQMCPSTCCRPPSPKIPAGIAAMRRCCTGLHLKIGLPPYSTPPIVSYTDSRFSGFLVALIDALAAEMGFDYEFIADTLGENFWKTAGPPGVISPEFQGAGGTIDLALMPGNMLSSACHGGLYASENEDVCLLNYMSQTSYEPYMLLTTPFYTGRFSGLVKVSSEPVGPWRLFEPFSFDVWMALAVVIVGTAIFMVVIDHLWPSTDTKGKVKFSAPAEIEGLAKVLYHTSAACLGGEDYEWMTWPARLLRLSLLLCVLVLVSTYTANLASFFTKPTIIVHGPKQMNELPNNRVCVPHRYLYRWLVEDFLLNGDIDYLPGTETDPVSRETGYRMEPTLIQRGTQYCLESIAAGTSQIFVGDRNVLHLLHLENCDTTAEANFLSISSLDYTFITNGHTSLGQELAVNFSKAIALFRQQRAYQQLEAQYFQAGSACPDVEHSELAPVSFHQLGGLFFLVSALAGSAMLLAILRAPYLRCQASRSIVRGDEDESYAHATEGEMLRELLRKVSNLEGRDEQKAHDGPGARDQLEPYSYV